ncbi:MAG: alpha/beta fold hydrolase [Archangium sp.]
MHGPIIKTKDGVELFHKDLGPKDAQPIFFHHGWPLSSDDWEPQLLFFLHQGYRVIAHDRRAHGRSEQVAEGHDFDTWAADVAAIVDHLQLKNAIHVGHSMGGGEALRYVVKHGKGRVAKLVLIAAIPPLMLKTANNPDGVPKETFDEFRKNVLTNRAQFFLDVPSGPFFSFNKNKADKKDGIVNNWWRQGMAGSSKAQYDAIKAFSETDFTEDLKACEVPTLVMHGDDDQVVPIANSALKAIKLLKNGTLKVYEKLSHGLHATHPELINGDLLAFMKG